LYSVYILFQIVVRFRISWRLTYDDNTYCDDDVIANGQMIGSDKMTCFNGCKGGVGSLKFQCTDYSPRGEGDWSSGRGTVIYTPRPKVKQFEFG